jgi:sec-independent protein translocase protein TatA
MNTLTLAMLGWPEIVMILVVVLILFGAKKLPELAKGLGSGIKEFKKATKDVQEDLQRAIEDEPAPPPRRTATPASESSDSKAA